MHVHRLNQNQCHAVSMIDGLIKSTGNRIHAGVGVNNGKRLINENHFDFETKEQLSQKGLTNLY